MKKRGLFLFVILVMATFLILPDGIGGGDEGVIFASAKAWVDGGFSFKTLLANPAIDHSYVAHHFLWFFMQAALYGFLTILKPILPLLKDDLILVVVMTSLQVAATFVAIAMTYFFIKKNKPADFSLLATAFVWLGSYGIGFLTGGFVEATLCVLVLSFLWMLTRIPEWTFKNVIALALISFLITAVKQYGLIFCGLYFTAHFFLRRNAFQQIRFFVGYVAVLALLLVPWFWIRSAYFFSPGYYTSMIKLDGGILVYSKRIFDMLFGLSYGLFWTVPFLVLALSFPSNFKNLREWAPKITATVCMLLFFGIFRIGVGDGAVAGNRFFFPFLLVFIPEVVQALSKLHSRGPKFLLIVPLSVILFFPTLQYRHDVILWSLRRTETFEIKGNRFFSDFIPDLHPAVFAWKVQIAKLFHQKDVVISIPGPENIVLETNRIAPVPAGPHMVYSLKEAPTMSENYYRHVFSHLPDFFAPILELALYVLLFTWCLVLTRIFLICSKSGIETVELPRAVITQQEVI